VLRLKYTQVLAPDAGVISARTATVGAVVGNGTELFRLIRQGRLEWRAEVTAAELGRLVVGTRVSITAGSGAPLQGRVRMVAPTVDPQTRTGLVYVDLTTSPQGKAGAVKPGMFARGEFELGNSQALTVPQQAVVVRDGFSYAFRLNADQRVSQVKLTTGRRVGERVEVLEGISPDAVLVASGAGFLNDGDLVKVVPAEKSVSNSPLAPASQAVPATK
jgi:RND family efflux transporter MFP subunit